MKHLRLSKGALQGLLKTMDHTQVDSVDRERGEAMKEALRITANANRGIADFGTALRMVLLSDQDLFEEVAWQQEQKGDKEFTRAFDRFYGSKTFERASQIDADAGAGDADLATLYVEKSIKKRVESESPLLQYLDRKKLTSKSGKFPKSSNLAKAAFAASSADLTDLTNTVDVGLDNTAIEAEKFGGTMFLEQEAFAKLDPAHISQLMDELTLAYRRGMIDQIVNGNGTPPNATGLATNATAVTFSGNVFTTIVKMVASIADKTRGGLQDIFILTNSAGAMTYYAESSINLAYNDLIDGLGGPNFMKKLPVIEENVIVSSGSSPDVTAPLYVGKKGDYLIAEQTDPRIEMDKYGDFKAGGETARIMSFWNGKPHYNDGFAKTTIPAIY